MKKIVCICVCCLLVISLGGCGSQKPMEEVDNIIITGMEDIMSNELLADVGTTQESSVVSVDNAPTVQPAVQLTKEPVVKVTPKPTATPTVQPTEEPTLEPMEGLEEEQVIQSTTEPEVTPTAKPVAKPIVVTTPKPTVVLTMAPTIVPTIAPTVQPAEVATAVPSPAVTAPPVIATPAPAEHVHTMVWHWWQVEELEGEKCIARGRCVDMCADCGYVQSIHGDWIVYDNCELGEVVWIQERTCLQDGLYTQYCIKCGWQCDVKVSPAKGEHTMCQTILSIEGATCSTEGSEVVRHYCQYCDEVTYEETIVRPINDYHPASCFFYENDDGQMVRRYTCYECGLVWEEIW